MYSKLIKAREANCYTFSFTLFIARSVRFYSSFSTRKRAKIYTDVAHLLYFFLLQIVVTTSPNPDAVPWREMSRQMRTTDATMQIGATARRIARSLPRSCVIARPNCADSICGESDDDDAVKSRRAIRSRSKSTGSNDIRE